MLEFGIATALLIITILIGFPIAYSIGLTTIFYIFITQTSHPILSLKLSFRWSKSRNFEISAGR